jgi:hypothetical protein
MAKLSKSDHDIISNGWHIAIRAATKHKKRFKDGFDISKKFAYGSHEFMFEETMPEVEFKATVPKVWEMINILGPMLSFRNPHRNVRPRFEREEDPRRPRAETLEKLLNYSAHELDLVKQMRQCVDGSILGCGVMWLEKDGFSDLWGHFFDSADNLLMDPDAEDIEDALWIARKRYIPRWEFAGDIAEVPLDDPDLPTSGRPNIIESIGTVSTASREEDEAVDKPRAGKTTDLLTVYEVWSKIGIGWRLKSVPEDNYTSATEEMRAIKEDETLEFRHFYILLNSKKVWSEGEWPVPLWADNSWPCELLYYRKEEDYVWPTPMLVPSLGLQKAINWIVMFLWVHLKTTSRDFIVGSNELDETVREKILSGMDLEWIPLNTADLGDKKWSDLVGFLQHPNAQADLWRYLDLAVKLFEDSTGLYPELYARSGPAEPRSATASNNQQARADIRPDDMREMVERLHSKMARKECIAVTLDGDYNEEFVGRLLGPEAAQAWSQYRDGDLWTVMRELDYRIEAGSAARPNLQTEYEQALAVFDRLMQIAGSVGDINAVNKMAYQFQKAMNILDADIVQFQPPPPPEQEQDPTMDEKVREQGAKADLAELKAATEQIKQEAERRKSQPESEPAPGEIYAVEGGQPIYG